MDIQKEAEKCTKFAELVRRCIRLNDKKGDELSVSELFDVRSFLYNDLVEYRMGVASFLINDTKDKITYVEMPIGYSELIVPTSRLDSLKKWLEDNGFELRMDKDSKFVGHIHLADL